MISTLSQRFIRTLLFLSITLSYSSWPASSQIADNPSLSFAPKHRVNAHGDEFNSLARTADGRFAIIGTEKGDLLLWNLTSQKIERTLHQPSAVHYVVALSDSRYLVAAGSNHYAPRNSLVRKWNLANGMFEDLPGLPTDSFPTALAFDSKTGLVAVGVSDGTIIVWNSATNKVVANFKTQDVPIALALMGRDVYVVGIPQESLRTYQEPAENWIVRFNVDNPNQGGSEFLKTPGRLWDAIDSSPDNQLLVASFREQGTGEFTVIIEPHSRSELAKVEGSQLAGSIPQALCNLRDSIQPE